MTWLFKPASSINDGGGHVMRSIALAKAWFSPVVFSVDRNSPFQQEIQKSGFSYICNDEEDSFYNGIFVDSYKADFDRYRKKTNQLMLIEDHCDLYDKADIYLRPYETNLEKHSNALMLEGLDYALISSLYSECLPKNPNQLDVISVAFGLYDSKNATQYVLNHLQTRKEVFHTQVILGENAKHRSTVAQFLKNEYGRSYDLIINAPNLVQVYENTDFLFSMGGTTNLEACASGVLSCALNLNASQVGLSKVLSEQGMILYAGQYGTKTERLAETLDNVFDVEMRRKLYQSLRGAIDTEGVRRVSKQVETYVMDRQTA